MGIMGVTEWVVMDYIDLLCYILSLVPGLSSPDSGQLLTFICACKSVSADPSTEKSAEKSSGSGTAPEAFFGTEDMAQNRLEPAVSKEAAGSGLRPTEKSCRELHGREVSTGAFLGCCQLASPQIIVAISYRLTGMP